MIQITIRLWLLGSWILFPVSEMLCSLEYRMMNEVQKTNNAECYTPSPGLFIFHLRYMRQSQN
jgi:hypothetical protein